MLKSASYKMPFIVTDDIRHFIFRFFLLLLWRQREETDIIIPFYPGPFEPVNPGAIMFGISFSYSGIHLNNFSVSDWLLSRD